MRHCLCPYLYILIAKNYIFFQEMSSTWIRNVPKIVERRGGILPEGKSSVRGSWDISRKPSLIRAREVTQVEPGLWAVSQYVSELSCAVIWSNFQKSQILYFFLSNSAFTMVFREKRAKICLLRTSKTSKVFYDSLF